MNPNPSPAPDSVVLLGVPFHVVDFPAAVDWCVQRMKSGPPGYVATANLDFIMQAWRDPELQRILLEADLVIADGMPILWLARLFGPPLPERVTGSDLVPLLSQAAQREQLSLFLLGGAPGTAPLAADILRERHPGLQIAGTLSPARADVLDMDHEEILSALDEARPHCLLVAFGAPKQEKFINLNLRRWRVPLSIGVGGTLDFIAGVQQRAPVLLQKLGLEWLWRLGTDPGRLLQRYRSNLGFLVKSTLQSLRLKWSAIGPGTVGAFTMDDALLQSLKERKARLLELPALPTQDLGHAFTAEQTAGEEHESLVLDLAARRWLNSVEIAALVRLGRHYRDRGRRIFLIRVPGRINDLLRLWRLARYLDIPNDREDLLTRLDNLARHRREGAVLVDEDGGVRVELPDELNAATVDTFRRWFEVSWQAQTGKRRLRRIIVEAGGMYFMDSAGIGFLVMLKGLAATHRCQIHFTGFHGSPLRTLQVARMTSLLD